MEHVMGTHTERSLHLPYPLSKTQSVSAGAGAKVQRPSVVAVPTWHGGTTILHSNGAQTPLPSQNPMMPLSLQTVFDAFRYEQVPDELSPIKLWHSGAAGQAAAPVQAPAPSQAPASQGYPAGL